jgi:hypothetical protein
VETVETRLHGAALAGPLGKGVLLALLGGAAVTGAWPLPLLGAALAAAGAAIALRAVWRWERTRLVLTAERLVVVRGTLRRRTTAIPLDGAALELEQSASGRFLGYASVVADDLRVDYVPEPRRLLDGRR